MKEKNLWINPLILCFWIHTKFTRLFSLQFVHIKTCKALLHSRIVISSWGHCRFWLVTLFWGTWRGVGNIALGGEWGPTGGGETRLLLLQPDACLLATHHTKQAEEEGGGRGLLTLFTGGKVHNGVELEDSKAPTADQSSVAIVADIQRPPRSLPPSEETPKNQY